MSTQLHSSHRHSQAKDHERYQETTPNPDHHHPENFIPTLPEDIILDYLAEGAANVVYRISFPPRSPAISSSSLSSFSDNNGPNTPPPTELEAIHVNPLFQHRLLRLRKSIPSSQITLQTFEAFQTTIAPLFPSACLVEQDIVRLPPDLLDAANAGLQRDEEAGKRTVSRRGVYLASDESFGILVSDMTPNKEVGEVTVEFKTKWLAQSPSAPLDARRCRTCALRAMRDARARAKNEESEGDYRREGEGLCTLDLVSDDRRRVEVAVRRI